jgi:hypothetical protein
VKVLNLLKYLPISIKHLSKEEIFKKAYKLFYIIENKNLSLQPILKKS